MPNYLYKGRAGEGMSYNPARPITAPILPSTPVLDRLVETVSPFAIAAALLAPVML